MDIVEKVVEYLERDGNKRTLDLRVTYTHSGVKVNISYVGYSGKQKKPFPTLLEALIEALTEYEKSMYAKIKYAEEDFKNGNEAQRVHFKTNIELFNKHLPNARKALAYIESLT